MAPSSDIPELTSSTPSEVRVWLKTNHSSKLVATLDKFEIELRLGRLTSAADPSLMDEDGGGLTDGSSTNTTTSRMYTQGTTNRRLVTRRTVELFKVLIGSARWKTGAQLMLLLKGLGRELHAAGGHREPAIGNVVRRIMSCVREEVARHAQEIADEEQEIGHVVKRLSDSLSMSSPTTTSVKGSVNVSFADGTAGSSREGTPSASSANKIQRNLSLASMLWAHPQHVTVKRTNSGVKQGSTGTGGGPVSGGSVGQGRLRSNSLGSEHPSGTSPVNRRGSAGGGLAYHNRDATFLETLPESFFVARSDLRVSVMEAIQEIANDLEDLYKNIVEQATSHIHSDEVILTYGRSKTIELFLKAAASKKRKFQVFVCEGAPHYGGHAMAESLAASNIETVLINDSAACAIMARVNKVLLPAHAVMANGGLISASGSHMVALAAKQNSVPVVCITGMFKLCPQFPHEGQDTLNDLVSVAPVMSYVDITAQPGLLGCDDVEYINPIHDYIPPQLINLFVTNIGGFQPSYIYRLLAEYYHSDDWESFE